MLLAIAAFTALAPQGPELLSRAVRPLPHLGIEVRDERWLDRARGTIVRRLTDGAGNPVDGDALLVAEAEARDRATGKVSPELRARLGGEEPIEVVFWLERPAGMPDLRAALDRARIAGASTEDARRQALDVARRFTRPGNDAFAAVLEAARHTVVHVDDLAPIVFARLKPAAVAALAARPEVDQAYFSFPAWMEEDGGTELVGPPLPNRWASPTARTDAVHRRGVTGAGVKVMVNDTRNVVTSNPYLPPIVTGGTASTASHATAVAGIIGSIHPTLGGAAPGLAQIYSYGGYGDVNAPLAWAWGMTQGISFGNCSWWNGSKGRIVFLDRYFDYIIRAFGVMMFKSIGNQGNGDGKTTTPGNGYNVTGSGNAVDQNNHDWDDDVMSSSSSWVNPIEGHDKPEVAACGSGIESTTTSSPWTGSVGSGTSYASPVTCGTAALLAETQPAFQAQPEMVKAMLMAGAWHNVEGAAALSDRDGAGHIDAAASQSATAQGQFHGAVLTPGSFAAGEYRVTLSLVAGDEARIVAVWFSEADSAYATDVLKMDLDMVVEDPSGAVAASAASGFNAFEIVQFVPPRTGTYTVRMVQQRFQGQSEPFALAWTTRRNAATNQVTVQGTPALGATITLEFSDPYHPGALYAAGLSFTGPPAVTSVGPLKVVDFGFDGLTGASLSASGFSGVLGSGGLATTSLAIPSLPQLIGSTVYAAFVTVDPGVFGAVEETSPSALFTIR